MLKKVSMVTKVRNAVRLSRVVESRWLCGDFWRNPGRRDTVVLPRVTWRFQGHHLFLCPHSPDL